MNTYYGELIVKLREDMKLTQDDLAIKLGCSRQYISLIENNQRNLKNEYIVPLSQLLKFNFELYIEDAHKYKSIKHFILSSKIIDCLNNYNEELLKDLAQNETILKEFTYGTPYILKSYILAIMANDIENDYLKSEEIIYKVLGIKNRQAVANFTPVFHEEERYFSFIVLLSSVLYKVGENKLSEILLANTIDFLEKYFFSELHLLPYIKFYYKKLYIAILNNYTYSLFVEGRYNDALTWCQKTLKFINDSNIQATLESVLKIKIEIMYKLDKIEQAKLVYEEFKVICRLKDKNDYFESINQLIKQEYPLINTTKITA